MDKETLKAIRYHGNEPGIKQADQVIEAAGLFAKYLKSAWILGREGEQNKHWRLSHLLLELCVPNHQSWNYTDRAMEYNLGMH